MPLEKEEQSRYQLHFMKRFGVISLCFVLLYAGVAWALDECLRHGEHVAQHDAVITAPVAFDSSLVRTSSLPQRPVTKLHCHDVRYQIGPILQPSPSARLASFVDKVSLKRSFFTGSVVSSEINEFALKTLFELSDSFFFLSSSPRHLFLFVLRI